MCGWKEAALDAGPGVPLPPGRGAACLRGVRASPVLFSHIVNLSATVFLVGSSSEEFLTLVDSVAALVAGVTGFACLQKLEQLVCRNCLV